MGDELKNFVAALSEAHEENLKSIVLYGSSVVGGLVDDEAPKRVLVVLDRIMPNDLKAAHTVAEEWRIEGNPPPVYFTSGEIEDAADVFPIEFIDMSQVRHVLYGKDPFESLDIGTQNLRHQLEYELRGKLIRLRRLYMTVSHDTNRVAELMTNSLDSFTVLFRHALAILGEEAPFEKRECVMKLADILKLDKKVLTRILDYTNEEDAWLQSDTEETFAIYLAEIEQVIAAVDKSRDK